MLTRLLPPIAALALTAGLNLSAAATPLTAEYRLEQHAYWTCPDHAPETLAQLYETGWAAVFDQLQAQGVISDYGVGEPIGAVQVTAPFSEAGVSTPLPYDGFVWYQSPRAENLAGFWQTFDDQARTLDPDMARPFELCQSVLIVDYLY